MQVRIVLSCIVLAFCASAASGQVDVTRQEFDELVDSVKRLSADVRSAKEETAKRLAELRADIDDVTAIQIEDREQLRQLMLRDKDGQSYVRIDASHEPTRRQLKRAMELTVPDHGTLVLRNRMGYDILVAVNNTTYEVMAQTDREVLVPIGDARVKVQGQEAVYRQVGFPKYEAWATIRPQYYYYYSYPQTTASWITARPLYYASY